MYHSDWFELRYELIKKYPKSRFKIGSILSAFKSAVDNYIHLDDDSDILPNDYPDHFRLLKWWEHRTIEQLCTIKYMNVKEVYCSNYYSPGDIIEVSQISYNLSLELIFNLAGYSFPASQVEPATKEEYEKFKAG